MALTTTLSANLTDARGDCPGVITFKGSITSDKAQIVSYIFKRSDGATDTQPKTLKFTKAGQTKPVSTTWTLGGDGLPYYAGWEAVKITSPGTVTSSHANFQLRCNPPANSILAAHGNTDWHIDTANEFLFGKNMAGSATAPHHAPDSWNKTHIHIGISNTAKYYYDPGAVATGADTNIPNGIDRTMLFFYAGHGNPTIWSTLGDYASQASVRLANILGSGNLRYYWQCSCEVFAHGPQTCTPATTFEYACPDKFTGGADSPAMRNVFQRWGPALSSDLRMACGGSTEMYCHTDQVDRMWSDYDNRATNHDTLAQMFLDGFGQAGAYGVVPLCMTRGGNDITKTPLYDTEFTNAPNTSGASHFYLMYPAGSQQANTSPLLPEKIPQLAPIFKLSAALPPQVMKSLKPGTHLTISSALLAGGKGKLERLEQTGTLHVDSGKVSLPSGVSLEEKAYLQRATDFLREQRWQEQQVSEPSLIRYMTASMPVDGKPSDLRQSQNGVTVSYRRVIPVGDIHAEILGSAGAIRVRLNNDGAVLSASKTWRAAVPGTPVPIKAFDQARSEAIGELGNAAPGYVLDRWTWGYKERQIAGGQSELHPVYQFAFISPTRGDMEHPPRLIEIPAAK
ncbi:MAG: hypothetical protein PHY45_13035 [Rhodocyclaceae bacterium]|nr:hypothetical protein [Rhodocyclaceae bacterium]